MSTDHVIAGQIDYYRARAAEYDSWFNRTGRYDKGEAVNRAWFDEGAVVWADLARVPLDGADVLELAPGTGIWTEVLVKRARQVTVIDASPEMVDINRARLGVDAGKVEYLIADLFAWSPARPTTQWCSASGSATSRNDCSTDSSRRWPGRCGPGAGTKKG